MSVVLGQFVSAVNTLQQSGQLSGRTAARLERAARATAAGAAGRLHPKATHGAATAGTGVGDAQASTAADPAPASTPASASTPSRISGSGAGPAQPGANPARRAGPGQEMQKPCSSPWSGHHHHAGKGRGHDGFDNPQCQDGHYGWNGGSNDWQGGGGG